MNEPNDEEKDAAVDRIRERAWIEGHRAAWKALLAESMVNLTVFAVDDDPHLRIASLINELEDTRRQLRDVCKDYGDNDWDDDLYLADVVEKHLARHLARHLDGAR